MEPDLELIAQLRHAIMSPLSGMYMALQLEKKPELVARLKMVLDRLELLFLYAEKAHPNVPPLPDEEALTKLKTFVEKTK